MSFNPDELSLLNAHNSQFISELFELYLKNPDSVDEDWQTFFAYISDGSETKV